jgi:hypothetical protein
MAIRILTDEQRARYGRFTGPPTPDTLARHFHLDAADLTLIDELRGDHNRLGFAVMLGSARYLGTFLDQTADIPGHVLAPDPLALRALLGRRGSRGIDL